MSEPSPERLDEIQKRVEVKRELANATKADTESREAAFRFQQARKLFPVLTNRLQWAIGILFGIALVLMILRMFFEKNVPWQEVVALIGTGLGGIFTMAQILLKYVFPSK